MTEPYVMQREELEKWLQLFRDHPEKDAANWLGRAFILSALNYLGIVERVIDG